MTNTIFVSRHPGAKEWIHQKDGFEEVEVVKHFIPRKHRHIDVIGNLPVHLASQVCDSGNRYYHLSIAIPSEVRGKELSSTEMQKYGAKLVEFKVHQV